MSVKNAIQAVAFLFFVIMGRTASSQKVDVPETIIVNDVEYNVYQKSGHALVVPSFVQTELIRNTSVGLPPCDYFYGQLANWEYKIDQCNEGLETVERCDRFGQLFDNMRIYETDIVSPRLAQYWYYDLQEIVVSDAVIQQVAEILGLNADYVHAPAKIEADELTSDFAIVLAPFEDSWPARLSTIVELNSSLVTFYGANQTIVTNDHLVACGLLEGSVVARWIQPVHVKVGTNDVKPPLSSDELWAVYQGLIAKENQPQTDTDDFGLPNSVFFKSIIIGWNIRDVLEELNLNNSNTDSNTICEYILGKLYSQDDSNIALLLDLTEEDFVEDVVPFVEFDITVLWKGVSNAAL